MKKIIIIKAFIMLFVFDIIDYITCRNTWSNLRDESKYVVDVYRYTLKTKDISYLKGLNTKKP